MARLHPAERWSESRSSESRWEINYRWWWTIVSIPEKKKARQNSALWGEFTFMLCLSCQNHYHAPDLVLAHLRVWHIEFQWQLVDMMMLTKTWKGVSHELWVDVIIQLYRLKSTEACPHTSNISIKRRIAPRYLQTFLIRNSCCLAAAQVHTKAPHPG